MTGFPLPDRRHGHAYTAGMIEETGLRGFESGFFVEEIAEEEAPEGGIAAFGGTNLEVFLFHAVSLARILAQHDERRDRLLDEIGEILAFNR
jgi:hypothetical protein